MKSPDTSPVLIMRNLKLIWAAILAGQVMLLIVLYVASRMAPSDYFPSEPKELFFIVVAIIMLTAIFAGNFLFNYMLRGIKELPELTEKMKRYQLALIIRHALAEAATIVAAVFFYLTSDTIFLIAACVMTAYFIILRPALSKTSAELNLTSDEVAALTTDDNGRSAS